MGNPGIIEHRTVHPEAGALVEADRLHLRIQMAFPVTAASGLPQKRVQQGAPDAASPPRRHHGHAPDTPVRQQAGRTDGRAAAVGGQRVHAPAIVVVPLEGFGNALLADEDVAPDRRQCRPIRRPCRQLHVECGGFHGSRF